MLCSRSFMMSTMGSVGVTFVAGAIAAWGPVLVNLGLKVRGNLTESLDESVFLFDYSSICVIVLQYIFSLDSSSISFVFGVVTILAGILGVISGSLMAQRLRIRFPTADAVICGIGLLCSAPLFYGGLVLASGPIVPVYLLIFFALWFLCLNWALVGDMLLVNSFTFSWGALSDFFCIQKVISIFIFLDSM